MFRESLNSVSNGADEKKESKKFGKELIKDALRCLVFHNKKAKVGDIRVVRNLEQDDANLMGDLLIYINPDGGEQIFGVKVAESKLLFGDYMNKSAILSERQLAAILAEVEEPTMVSFGEQPEVEPVAADDVVVRKVVQRCITIKNKSGAEPMDINGFNFKVNYDESGDNYVLRAQDSQGKEAKFIVSGALGVIDVGAKRLVNLSDRELDSLSRLIV